jgi:predicted metal-dependent phosphoesterase TrpH
VKIDLHLHSSERSSCGKSSENDMLSAAARFGLDAVVFTEHNRTVGPDHLELLNERFSPLRVFGGIEISLTMNDHCLVLGVDDPGLTGRAWRYTDLVKFVREHDGWIALCHPFRMSDDIPFPIHAAPPDGIELHSVHTGADDGGRIARLAQEFGVTLLGNSDAHFAPFVGIFYNEIPGSPQNMRELVAALRAGPVTPCSDASRVGILNRMIDEREATIRNMLERKMGVAEFCAITGMSAAHYDRVKRGRSFRV